MAAAREPFRIRSIAVAAFLPTLLFSLGQGAVIPVLPGIAADLGADLPTAGLIAGMILIGQVLGDLPGGLVVARLGERRAMLVAAGTAVAGAAVALVAPSLVVLAAGVLLAGIAGSVFALARHAYLTTAIPLSHRARALSTLGGAFRAGAFLGPLLTAAAVAISGTPRAALGVFVLACAAVVLVLLLAPDPPAPAAGRAPPGADGSVDAAPPSREGLGRTLLRHRRVLVRLGAGAALVAALRASRTVLLPLWAVSLGIGQAEIALIIAVANAVDFALFYTSGQIMDRWGRLWSAVPSLLGMSAGFGALAFTHDLPDAVPLFVAVTVFLALANGIGSGVLMTLGSDLAPAAGPAPFLGAWRFSADAGAASAPLMISGVVAVASLPVAAGILAVGGVAGAALFAYQVPRLLTRRA